MKSTIDAMQYQFMSKLEDDLTFNHNDGSFGYVIKTLRQGVFVSYQYPPILKSPVYKMSRAFYTFEDFF